MMSFARKASLFLETTVFRAELVLKLFFWILPSAKDNGNSHRLKGSEVGRNLFLIKDTWMREQGMGGSSGGWLRYREESAINGWDVSRMDESSDKG